MSKPHALTNGGVPRWPKVSKTFPSAWFHDGRRLKPSSVPKEKALWRFAYGHARALAQSVVPTAGENPFAGTVAHAVRNIRNGEAKRMMLSEFVRDAMLRGPNYVRVTHDELRERYP